MKKKYIVLQNFWLRDIMLCKGQIITDPVSPRWIDLRLIKPYHECTCSVTVRDPIVNDDNLNDSQLLVATDSIDESKIHETKTCKKRGRPKKVVFEKIEKSETLL